MNQAMQVLTSHESAEWYTPPPYVELAREALGGVITVDPASNPVAQAWIQARAWYGPQQRADWEQDGLSRHWWGTVFLNPPYGKVGSRSSMDVWARKLEAEYLAGRTEEAVLLVNSTFGYAWYERLFRLYPVCLAAERIRFVKPDGTAGGQAKRGQSFFYLGPNVKRFRRVFSPVGRIVLPEIQPDSD